MRASGFFPPVLLLVAGLFIGTGQSAFSEEGEKGGKSMFAGAELEPLSGTFLVARKGVNYRDAPKTDGKRLGTLETGTVVTVLGKAKGSDWYAIAVDGKELGYAFGPVMVRLIDGSLDEPLKGTAKGVAGAECRYTIRYDGESRVEGESMITADYTVDFACRREGKSLRFAAFMFLTEVPFDLSIKSGYQINVEIGEIGGEYEEALTATVIYSLSKGEVVLETVTPKQFAPANVGAKRPAANVAEALRASVEMAVGTWNAEVWTALFKLPH